MKRLLVASLGGLVVMVVSMPSRQFVHTVSAQVASSSSSSSSQGTYIDPERAQKEAELRSWQTKLASILEWSGYNAKLAEIFAKRSELTSRESELQRMQCGGYFLYLISPDCILARHEYNLAKMRYDTLLIEIGAISIKIADERNECMTKIQALIEQLRSRIF